MKKRKVQNFELRPGDTGIMLTCFKGREHTISTELMNMISTECEDGIETEANHLVTTSSFSDAFETELKSLESEKITIYHPIAMGDVKCIVFAKFLPKGNDHTENQIPLKLATKIWDRALNTGVKHSRYSCTFHNETRHGQRLIPIEISCRASPDALMAIWPRFVESHPDIFGTKSNDNPPGIITVWYAVVVEKRLNNDIQKETVKEIIASLMASHHGPSMERFVVSLKTPMLVIMVQVVKGFLGISGIVHFANTYKSGNIQLLADAYRATNSNNASSSSGS